MSRARRTRGAAWPNLKRAFDYFFVGLLKSSCRFIVKPLDLPSPVAPGIGSAREIEFRKTYIGAVQSTARFIHFSIASAHNFHRAIVPAGRLVIPYYTMRFCLSE